MPDPKDRPTVDIIIRKANLPDGRHSIDSAVEGTRIAVVGRQIEVSAREEIVATGRLVAPPFNDPHFHMDATISLGLPRLNRSCTLL